ncbi:MAG: TRAP transporter small permease subunit [Alphaproteobacteria bacterium]
MSGHAMSNKRAARWGDPLAVAQKALETISRVAVWIGGAAYIGVCALVAADILLRKFANVTIGGADEISGYVLAVTTAWALSFTLFQRAHIRIDALYNLLPVRVCAALDILALLALGYLASLMTWWGHTMLLTSISFHATANTPLQTPLWIPQSLWWTGLAFFCLTLLVLILRAGQALLHGDAQQVGRIAGIRTVEDEIESEIGADRVPHHAKENPAC